VSDTGRRLLAAAMGALAGFSVLAWLVDNHDPIWADRVVGWFIGARMIDATHFRHTTALGRQLAELVAVGGSLPVFTAAIAAAFVIALQRQDWQLAVVAAVSAAAGPGVAEVLLKPLVGRTIHGGYRFPSVHVVAATTAAAIWILLMVRSDRPELARPTAAWGVAAVGLVSASVVWLGWHFFTDALGGFLWGSSVVLTLAAIIQREPKRGRLRTRSQ
jgi:membrane-associated phospholipid phosphatase